MKETRGGRYGLNLAIWVEHTFESIPEEQREDYKIRVIKGLKAYSFEPRKEDNQELESIVNFDVSNPEHLASLVKEGINLMYQKRTANRVIKTLLEHLEK